MATFNSAVERTGVPIPEPVAAEVIKTATASSAAMRLMRRVPMSTKTNTVPVLSALPTAFWVDGDTGLKQTSKAAWEGVKLTAEELAVLVPIPNALVADSQIPLWDELKPLLAQAIGTKLDEATLFGVDKPASWTTASVVPGAVAAGNVVTESANAAVDVAAIGGEVATDGFNVTGFLGDIGVDWRFAGAVDGQGRNLFVPNATDASLPGSLYGRPLHTVASGAWPQDAAGANPRLIGADWNKFALGLRQDLTFDLFDQMVISDAAGKVIFNAAQQDSKVMRVVMRVGYAAANPATVKAPNAATRFPAAVLRTAAA